MVRLNKLTAAEVVAELPALTNLLLDAVDSGASVGFLPPLGVDVAREYWNEVIHAIDNGNRILIAAFHHADLVGSVQLDLAAKPNALHRAEVMKLFVHRKARRQGIATMLITAVELAAKGAGRNLLILDTRQGDPSEYLYLSLGYRHAGVIPRYARSESGELHSTVFLYRELA